MRYLYTILFYLALPFLFLRLLWRSRNNSDYRKRWEERLGFSPHRLKKCIWIHAVSVGETIAAIPLIKALQKQFPTTQLLITNMTPTGAARVKATFGDSVLQAYIPYDLPDAIRRFLWRTHPRALIIMETELWPNLFHACHRYNIPLIITNARLSEKSFKGYQRIAPLTREMLNAVNILAAQAKADADRFIALGIAKDKVHVTGNIKFDLKVPIDLPAKSTVLREQLGQNRFIWIAASTHPGEEEIIFEAARLLNEKIPNALLILVPRHLERFDSVVSMSEQQGFKTIRRSRNENCQPDVKVFIGDTMGELLLLYSVSDVAFVAGSFASIGGHNMLEPAVLKKPVITGPYLFNFAEISELLLANNGMIKVQNAKELAAAILKFYEESEYRIKTGENAHAVVEKNRGALQKQIELVRLLV